MNIFINCFSLTSSVFNTFDILFEGNVSTIYIYLYATRRHGSCSAIDIVHVSKIIFITYITDCDARWRMAICNNNDVWNAYEHDKIGQKPYRLIVYGYLLILIIAHSWKWFAYVLQPYFLELRNALKCLHRGTVCNVHVHELSMYMM